jgi:hypothetical protein
MITQKCGETVAAKGHIKANYIWAKGPVVMISQSS